MKKYISTVAHFFCFLAFLASIQVLPAEAQEMGLGISSAGGRNPGVVTRKINYKKADELMKGEKWNEAVELLQSYSADDDIFYADWNDVLLPYRSPKRKFLIAQCLVHLGKPDEAKKELRSFFEIKITPHYVELTDVLTLLIDLETVTDYEAFEAWMQQYLTVPDKRSYRGSVQQLVNIKKDVESGRFDTGYEVLRTINTSRLYGKAKLQWHEAAALSYFKRNPKSLGYLLQKLAAGSQSEPDKSIIYCVGEMANPEALPVLRKLKEQVRNSYILEEIAFALAKSDNTTTQK